MKKINSKRKKVFLPKQIHSNKFYLISKKISNKRIKCDAIITDQRKIPIGVLTADCAPIFFFDSKKNIISAVHAGWKGAKNGVIKNSIKLMLECGSNLNNIISCIGPCIGKNSYTVKNDFFKEIMSEDKKNNKFFLKKNNKMSFDLKSYIIKKIENYGVKNIISKSFDKKDISIGLYCLIIFGINL